MFVKLGRRLVISKLGCTSAEGTTVNRVAQVRERAAKGFSVQARPVSRERLARVARSHSGCQVKTLNANVLHEAEQRAAIYFSLSFALDLSAVVRKIALTKNRPITSGQTSRPPPGPQERANENN